MCGVWGCVFVLSFHPHVPRAHPVPHGSRVTSQLESVRVCVEGLFVLSLHPPPMYPELTLFIVWSKSDFPVRIGKGLCVCVWGVLSLHPPPPPRTQSSPCSLCGARVTSQLELVMVCVWGGWGGVCYPFTPAPPCTQSSPCSICGVSSLII